MVYTKKPEHFNSDWEVVGCFVECNGSLLLLQRQDGKSESGLYGLVGGKVESDDADIYDAMIRELYEETGLDSNKRMLRFFQTVYVENFNYKATFHLFELILEIKPNIVISYAEHMGYTWASIDTIHYLPLMEDLVPCIALKYDK